MIIMSSSSSTSRRRSKTTTTMTAGLLFSADVWRLIGANAYACPHVVFRLRKVCRGIRDALRDVDPDWWAALVRRVCAHARKDGGRGHYAKMLCRLWTHQDPERGLRAVCATRCEGCGARRGHRLLRPYAMRVCVRCLREGLVSNLALELMCGVAFCDFLPSYLASGGFFLPMRAFGPVTARVSALRQLAPDYDSRLANVLVFFWRADVERLVLQGERLAQRTLAHAERWRAALTLAAHVRRKLRTRAPRPVSWMPGGPHQLHTGRARYTPEGLSRWEACLTEATERLRPHLSLRWLPDAADASI
jgi:hypothetical protein